MNTVRLLRTETSDEGTFGKLYVNDKFLCYTGELPREGGDPNVENERCVDCIPEGTYTCNIHQSAKLGRVYMLADVPGRSGVCIHKGNFCGNKAKGYQSHVEGCIILGMRQGILDGQKAVTSSKDAFDRFMLLMAEKPFELTIEWGE